MVNEDKIKKKLLRYAEKIDSSKWNINKSDNLHSSRGYSTKTGNYEIWLWFKASEGTYHYTLTIDEKDKGEVMKIEGQGYYSKSWGKDKYISTSYPELKKLFDRIDKRYIRGAISCREEAEKREISKLQKLEKFLSE